MLGWLSSQCPLDTGEKLWIECRMRWLAGKLGLDRLLGSEVILPEHRFFPDPFAGTPDDARRIFGRVCGYMGLDPERFDLDVVPDDSIRGAVGLYCEGARAEIKLAHSQLADPERMVATIAHELAHEILLGGGLLTVDVEDHEQVTDLLPVFLGLGIFAANSPVRDRSYTDQNRGVFEINRQGYLPSRMFGYALALFAYARGEASPGWARHLRPDAAVPFKKGLRYLRKTGDSLFRPDTAHLPVIPPTEAEAIERLATGSATVRAMTLREIGGLVPVSAPASLVDAVVRRLGDRDDDVRIEAARTLLSFGEAARAAESDLIRCLDSRSAELRGHAAAALSGIDGDPIRIVPELTRMLQDPDAVVVARAADGLHWLAPHAASAVPGLVEAMRLMEVDCGLNSHILADTIVAIGPPEDSLKRQLDPIDPEVRKRIIRSLGAARLRREDGPLSRLQGEAGPERAG